MYRSGSKDGTYTLLGTTTATNYTDNKANAGYIYYYKVKAVNANSIKSDYSATVAATCHCARPVVKPDYLISTGKPYIKWTAVSGASKYYVYRSGSSNGTYKYVGTTTATNYTDNKANAGYTYYYKVKAVSKGEQWRQFLLQRGHWGYLPLCKTQREDHNLQRQPQADLERCGGRQQV